MARSGYVGHEEPDGEPLDAPLARFGVGCESSTGTVGRATFGAPVRTDDETTATYDTTEEVAGGIVARWMDRTNSRNGILRIEWTAVAVGVHTVEGE